jgi:membrane protein DedA with SNARE-associated domain
LTELIEVVLRAITNAIAALGYWGIGIGMAIESANIPLPSEVILPFGGYLVSTGQLEFYRTVLAGTVGGTIGSVLSYYLGLWGGRPFLVRYGRYFGFSMKHLALADRWFERYGEATVFFTRLMPVVRTFISLPAGISGMNFKRFLVYTILKGIQPGSIILLNASDTASQTPETLPSVIEKLRGEGYELVTVSSLLKHGPALGD